MPLTLVSAGSSRTLWEAFVERLLPTPPGPRLAGAGGSPGAPDEPGASDAPRAWIAHRNHRDLLYAAAFERGHRGWLDPPVAFLSDLPDRFGVGTRPAGLLTRRRLLTRLAVRHGAELDVGGAARGGGIARAHLLDGLVGELLSGGVEAAELPRALAVVGDDEFARQRNRWIAAVYRDYVAALAARERHDPRQLPALLAARIDAGGLPGALGGADELHVYGIHTLALWGPLVRALASQREVAVHLYLPREEEPSEWDRLEAARERLDDGAPARAVVQPVPDRHSETRWVAWRVKTLLADGDCPPWEVAVVARSGDDDVRRAHAALEDAGVPATARIRTPLSEIAALKAVLEVLAGVASGWPYRTLRNVLGSPYFDVRVDLRFIDEVAATRRIEGLERWEEELERGASRLEKRAAERESEGLALLAGRARDSLSGFRDFRSAVADLAAPRPEGEWIETTLGLLAAEGLFHVRQRVSRPVRDRWDVVRLDQRGILQVEALLREWRELDLDDRPLAADAWHTLLRRLLEGHQLALTTPDQKGVQVLEAHDAALTPFRHVFVVHANDGVFPRVPAARGVLTEGERVRLRERGALPLTDRETALRRERTLWRAATAVPRLTVTYRTASPSGTPLLPSLMVPAHEPEDELSRTWEPPDPVAPGPLDRDLAAALASTRDAVVSPAPDRLRQAVVAAHAEDARRALEVASAPADVRPGPWTGVLRDPVVLANLAERYGSRHVWSASQLEQYASCPFLFFVERVLRLEDLSEAEEETSALTFGSVAHSLLERFWRRVMDDPPQEWDERSAAVLDEVRAEVLRSLEEGREWTGHPVLWRETWAQVGRAVRDYLEWELPKLVPKDRTPADVEHGFGRDDGPPVPVEGTALGGERVRILLAGRIDRVDRLPDGSRAIVDYKSSWVPGKKTYLDGTTLQSALYSEALAASAGVPVSAAGYRSIRQPGRGSRGDVGPGDDAYRTALAIALAVPGRVRGGRFEPVQAASAGWRDYHPGRDVCRTRGALSEGHRFGREPDR